MNPDRAVLIVTVICALLAPPSHADTLIINGQERTEHVDARDAPTKCGESGIFYAACTDRSKRRIDYRSPVLAWIVKHEHGHASGMRHGEYEYNFAGNCATVTASGGKYHAGDTICSTRGGEILIPTTKYAEAK